MSKTQYGYTSAGGGGSAGNDDGIGTAARFYQPAGIDVSPDGTTLAICDSLNHRIRFVDVVSRRVTTFGGHQGSEVNPGVRRRRDGAGPGYVDGAGAVARFRYPEYLSYSPDGSIRAWGVPWKRAGSSLAGGRNSRRGIQCGGEGIRGRAN